MIKFNNLNNLSAYLKKSDAENIYMKKINSLNISFTELLTSISTKFTYYDDKIANLNYVVNSIGSSVESLKSFSSSAYCSITSLENQTLYLNNEFYSIKTNTQMIYGIVEGLTTAGINYDYWNEFSKLSNETYLNFDLNSTVVKNEQLTYNINLSSSISNTDKNLFVLNQNLLNTSITVNNELSRLGLKMNSTNQPLTATATYIDIAAYQNIGLNNSFSLECQSLNLINSGGNINLIDSNINASTINFNGMNNNSTYTLNLNPNVKNLSNIINNCYLYLTNNGDNTLTISTLNTIRFGENNDTFKNIVFDGAARLSKNGGDLLVDSISANSNYYQYNNLNNYTIKNCSFESSVSLFNSVNSFCVSNCSMMSIYGSNYYGHATAEFVNNSIGSLSFNNPGNLNLVGNTITSILTIGGNLNMGATINNNSVKYAYLTFSNQNDNYNFEVNTISTLYLSAHNDSFSFSNLDFTGINAVDCVSCKFYSMTEQTNMGKYIEVGNWGNKIYSYDFPNLVINGGNCALDSCHFKYASITATNFSNAQNWRYATIDYILWQNSYNETFFYEQMMNINNGLFHVNLPGFWTDVEYAVHFGNANIDLGGNDCLVGNPDTTSVNLSIFNNPNKKIHANFINGQNIIKSIDFRGWNPTQIIDFDQYYLFNNVASNILDTDISFTMRVNNSLDWTNYINFINPFGDNNSNRIIFVE
jgi:hypothetical protein